MAQPQGAKILAAAIVASQCCALLRYVVFAHTLGPTEVGLGVVIILVGQFFDFISDSGSDRFLIQHPQGNEPEAQRLVQLFMFVRGLVIAALLLVFAEPIAHFLEAPQIVSGIRMMALVPFFSCFVNLDWRRVQRDHDFRMEGRVTLISEICSLALTIALALITRDHVAMIAGLISRSLFIALATQVMSVRRFELGYSKPIFNDLLHFALPLMLTGAIFFFGSQGDRVLIGKIMGPAEVGRYSATMLMMFYPMAVLQRFTSSLYLPQMVRDNAHRESNADQLGGVVTILGSAATIGFAIVAPYALPILFGHAFSQVPSTMALIGALNVVRFLKLWPVNMLLSHGLTRSVLLTHLTVLIAFPLAIAGSHWSMSLDVIVLAFILGELVSLVCGLWRASGAFDLSVASVAERLALFLLATVIAVIASVALHEMAAAWIAAMVAGILIFAGLLWWRERAAVIHLLSLLYPAVGAQGKQRLS